MGEVKDLSREEANKKIKELAEKQTSAFLPQILLNYR